MKQGRSIGEKKLHPRVQPPSLPLQTTKAKLLHARYCSSPSLLRLLFSFHFACRTWAIHVLQQMDNFLVTMLRTVANQLYFNGPMLAPLFHVGPVLAHSLCFMLGRCWPILHNGPVLAHSLCFMFGRCRPILFVSCWVGVGPFHFLYGSCWPIPIKYTETIQSGY